MQFLKLTEAGILCASPFNLLHVSFVLFFFLFRFASITIQSKLNWIRSISLSFSRNNNEWPEKQKCVKWKIIKSLISIPVPKLFSSSRFFLLFLTFRLSADENLFYIIDFQPLQLECDNKWLNVRQHNKFSFAFASIDSGEWSNDGRKGKCEWRGWEKSRLMGFSSALWCHRNGWKVCKLIHHAPNPSSDSSMPIQALLAQLIKCLLSYRLILFSFQRNGLRRQASRWGEGEKRKIIIKANKCQLIRK
jgi:hypothetical protein